MSTEKPSGSHPVAVEDDTTRSMPKTEQVASSEEANNPAAATASEKSETSDIKANLTADNDGADELHASIISRSFDMAVVVIGGLVLLGLVALGATGLLATHAAVSFWVIVATVFVVFTARFIAERHQDARSDDMTDDERKERRGEHLWAFVVPFTFAVALFFVAFSQQAEVFFGWLVGNDTHGQPGFIRTLTDLDTFFRIVFILLLLVGVILWLRSTSTKPQYAQTGTGKKMVFAIAVLLVGAVLLYLLTPVILAFVYAFQFVAGVLWLIVMIIFTVLVMIANRLTWATFGVAIAAALLWLFPFGFAAAQ